MKRALLLILLLGVAVAGSALTVNDFNYAVQGTPTTLLTKPMNITVSFRLIPQAEYSAYNITVMMAKLPLCTMAFLKIILNSGSNS